MKQSNHTPIKQSIGFNLLRGVFSIYIVIAIIVTLAHMVTEYFNVKQMIYDDLKLYHSTYHEQLGDALWDLDNERVKTIETGMIKLPSVFAVEIADSSGNQIVSLSAAKKALITNDQIQITLPFEIIYQRENEYAIVGHGVLYSSSNVLIDKLSTGFTLIIINSVIKTIALWAIFLWLVRPMLIDPIEYMSKAVRDLDVDKLDGIKLTLNTRQKNELVVLADSFNLMTEKLNAYLTEINSTSQQLYHAKNYLEQLVASATCMMQAQTKVALFEIFITFLFKGLHQLNTDKVKILFFENSPLITDYNVISFKFQFGDKSDSSIVVTPLPPEIDVQIPIDFPTNHSQFENHMVHGQHYLLIKITWQDTFLGKLIFPVPSEVTLSQADIAFLTTYSQILALSLMQVDIKDNLEHTIAQRTLDLEKSNHALELKALELEKVSNYKSHFLANMSHEIRTPLNGVFGSLQLLAHTSQDTSSKELINTAISSCQSLLTIINDILDFSKIEAGRLELDAKPFNFRELLTLIVNETKPLAKPKAITVSQTFGQHFNDYWQGDSTRIKQILQNIIANAIKFTHKGSVQVIADSSSSGLTIKVTDTGIGMTEDVISTIFNRFEQADKSITREYGGTGLGTNIALSLAQLMNGKIDVSSVPNEGSEFTITLPLSAAQRKLCDAHSKAHETIPNLAQKAIILAEDNPVNRIVFNKLMAPTKADVTLCENGQECLELMSSASPKLILMDIQMPVMDGITACKVIKQQSDIPVIALTANVMKEDVEKYRQVGFDAVLSKPINLNELYQICAQYLETEN